MGFFYASFFASNVDILSYTHFLIGKRNSEAVYLICKSHFSLAYCQSPAEISLTSAGHRQHEKSEAAIFIKREITVSQSDCLKDFQQTATTHINTDTHNAL